MSSGRHAIHSTSHQGQCCDSETGFYYLQSRYDDPSTGQFLSRDPENSLVPCAYAVGEHKGRRARELAIQPSRV